MHLLIVLLVVQLLTCCLTTEESFVRRIAVKIRENYQDSTLKTLSEYDLKLLYNILAIERVRIYEDTLKPKYSTQNLNDSAHKDCVECRNYYGMGVPDAWSLGYTGKGVVIAVTDVGIHTDLLDLKNKQYYLCYNFINDSKDITPEFFHNLQEKTSRFSSHGDNCASLIVAIFGNGFCASGIAFNAKAVGLKIFTVTLYQKVFPVLRPSVSTGSDIIARALVHNISEIDIFSNAWAPTKLFTPLAMVMEDALEYAAKTGRHGLGTLYVVPAGPAGYGLANNIHTIAVNGIGKFGNIPNDSFPSASVITSGLAEGSNLSAEYMYTTTRNNRCVTDFKGMSPATAQVAAIIGLALEANPKLSLRDIQHLLIQASEPDGLENVNGFIKNNYGRYFHRVFGYGLLNAKKLVTLAKARKTAISPMLERKARKLLSSHKKQDGFKVEFCYICDEDKPCLALIEQVMIKIKIPDISRQLRLVLESPRGTQSVLLDLAVKDELQLADAEYQQLTSVHFWDETAVGEWHLTISGNLYGQRDIPDVELTLFGTENDISNSMDNIRGKTSMVEQTKSILHSTIINSISTENPQDDAVAVFSFVLLSLWFVAISILACRDHVRGKKYKYL